MSGVSTSQHPSAVDDTGGHEMRANQVIAETITAKPTRAEAIHKIIVETGHTLEDANVFYDWWIDEVVPGMRASSGKHYYLPQEALDDPRKHGILDTIAPDGTTSRPGSAMRAVEESSLDFERGELGVIHGKARVHSNVHCKVVTRTVGFSV